MMQRKVLWERISSSALIVLNCLSGIFGQKFFGNAAVYSHKTECNLLGNQYFTVASIFLFCLSFARVRLPFRHS